MQRRTEILVPFKIHHKYSALFRNNEIFVKNNLFCIEKVTTFVAKKNLQGCESKSNPSN